ncbi:MAG: CRISPR-associated endonuclease Cas2 [bacterium]|nr:CRISPR-associated endonuclease Cas2 [bacterium]
MKTFRNTTDPAYKKEKRQLYAACIIKLLAGAAGIAVASSLGPAPTWNMIARYAKTAGYEHKKLRQALRRLERRGLVRRRRKRDDGNEYLLLAKAGEREFFRYYRRPLILKAPDKWDGFWRIIVFDITEDKKRIRDAVRRHLKRLGFYRLQKSVFVVPCPCDEEINFLRNFYEGESEICLVTAISLGSKEIEARKYFHMHA